MKAPRTRWIGLILWVCLSSSSAEPGDGRWSFATPADAGLDVRALERARDYALTAGGSGCIIRGGRQVMVWGDQKKRYDLKSTTKSFGAAALGLAIKDGKFGLDDKARSIHPTLGIPPASNRETGWIEEMTILHLASQTAGFEKPGGYTPLLFRPGTQWDYSDSGPNWLAECVTLAYRRDLEELMFDRIFLPIGIGRSDLVWRKNAYRPEHIEGVKRREFGSGISANVDAMARFGLLWLRGGQWGGKGLLPRSFIDQARKTVPGVRGLPVRNVEHHGRASDHYGLLWWNNADETLEGVPLDTYWSWGLHDSLIVIMPTLDMVVARAGESWPRQKGAGHYEVLKPFLVPIAEAARPTMLETAADVGPTPPSPMIKTIEWAPTETIIRTARGSDNWALTWADDDALYTAYGDGRGFEPPLDEKLSLGLAKIDGYPPDIRGVNFRSDAEARGDGRNGRKASGLLCIDGVLYLLVRNAANSQLGWSNDHGRTWTWADWRFTEGFGCPTFLNFGRDYAGARDDFAYIYSHDSASAYERADHMVLARVPKGRLRDRDAYEYFVRITDSRPVWTTDVHQRGAVFTHSGGCYRSTVSYNSGLKRYLWCQTGAGDDPRFAGGIVICDAPEPWGPWTTAFHAVRWDVGPGETCSFPTKWMSQDGRTLHLVFSGDDCFSVRRATLRRHHE